MSHPILIAGAAGGPQGSTGRLVANTLLKRGISVRAFVHKLDARSNELRRQGAEVIEGDLLNAASVLAAMKGVKRAFFTYPVADGLLEAAGAKGLTCPQLFSTRSLMICRAAARSVELPSSVKSNPPSK